MLKKTRRILFYGLIIVFLVFGSAIVFYSQGYRLNFSTLAIQKVGGIFIRSYPTNANVTLNGMAIKNQSWLLQNGTLVNNLLPETYTLTLESPGYLPWQKKVEVFPSLVSEEDSVILPRNAPPTAFAQNIIDAWFLDNAFILKNIKNQLSYDGKTLTGDTFVAATADKRFIITENTLSGIYYLTNTMGDASILNINLIFKNLRARVLGLTSVTEIHAVYFDPTDVNKLFLKTASGFYRMDLKNLTIKIIDRSKTNYFDLTSQQFIWQDEKNKMVNIKLNIFALFNFIGVTPQ